LLTWDKVEYAVFYPLLSRPARDKE
jgi:hypothetical protein